METSAGAAEHPREVTLRDLFRVFWIIGISSFGGGLTGWIYREIVENRRWLADAEFFAALSLARTMPGANVVNLSLFIGYRMRHGPGAAAAVSGVLLGPLILIVLCAALYQRWGHSDAVHQVLIGVAVAAIAMSLNMGWKALRATATSAFYALIVLLTFVGVGIMHWSMLSVAAALVPASVGWSFLVDRRDER
jgi:chromate transporter